MDLVNLERLRVHRKNIDRYVRLLRTRLTELERGYIERRLYEERSALDLLFKETFFDPASPPRLPRDWSNELASLLQPAEAFAHPMDVIDDSDLTTYEKRAILSSWAAQSYSAEQAGLRRSPRSFDQVLDALCRLGSEADHSQVYKKPGWDLVQQSGGNSFL
jgi:hypothetical protein